MNLKTAQQIFDSLPNDIRPAWALLILSRFDKYVKDIPAPVKELWPIVEDKDRWKEAHAQFTKIRVFLLENKTYPFEAYLLLAELVAKVTYNASGQPAPFDSDSGHYIPRNALKRPSIFQTINWSRM